MIQEPQIFCCSPVSHDDTEFQANWLLGHRRLFEQHFAGICFCVVMLGVGCQQMPVVQVLLLHVLVWHKIFCCSAQCAKPSLMHVTLEKTMTGLTVCKIWLLEDWLWCQSRTQLKLTNKTYSCQVKITLKYLSSASGFYSLMISSQNGITASDSTFLAELVLRTVLS